MRVQRRKYQLAGGGQVDGRPRADGRDPQRKAGVVGEHLHGAAEDPVLAGEPQVVGRFAVDLDAGGDPVSGDQRAVQAQEHHAGGAGPVEHVVQVGSVGGDDVEAFVQIPV